MANEKRLISVEKTVKELEGEIYWTDSTKAAIRAFLRTVPAVDAVEVVHGEWVHHYYDSGEPIDDKWYCSECHMCNGHRRTWYCPHCGAKMDGDGNA